MIDLVVVGLGYVGLPLVEEATRAGLSVRGLDVNTDVIEQLNRGQSHVDDLSDADMANILSTGFQAATRPDIVSQAQNVVICVPTPLSADGGPDLRAVKSSCAQIAPHLRPGTLVVLESTTYPGTTSEIVAPILEEGSNLTVGADILLAYSPERIDPGNAEYGLRNTPKVVGADSDEARRRAVDLYSRVADRVVVAKGTREAESAKLLENTYRQVNIALVNEMAKFFHELDIDFWDVIDLASTKPFGFQAFRPGPGVGGHCIPIDPSYLSHRVRAELGYGFRFVELAQEINQSMPRYVAQRAFELLNRNHKAVLDSEILLLGVAYKPNIADQRESPAIDVARRLQEWGAKVIYHDPLVSHFDVADVGRAHDLSAGLRSADLVVLLQNHADYDISEIEDQARLLLDTRGLTTHAKSERL